MANVIITSIEQAPEEDENLQQIVMRKLDRLETTNRNSQVNG